MGTTTVVRHCLDTRCGLAYCRERVRQRLHALGVRLRRLRPRHLRAKPEAQVALRAALEARLVNWPAEWELMVVDEAPVRRHPPLTAQWGLVDEVPEVPTGDAPTQVQVYGAVAPLTGRPHDHISPALGKQAFAPCLRHLLVYPPGPRLRVIHARGEQHQGAPVEALVREAQARLVLKAQPAYAPELKPQERLWQWLRRVVPHHHGCASLGAQIDAIRHFFRDLAGVKEQVRR